MCPAARAKLKHFCLILESMKNAPQNDLQPQGFPAFAPLAQPLTTTMERAPQPTRSTV